MSDKRNRNMALTGGYAAALALKHIEPDVMPVYPITPQTPIIETYAKYKSDGEVETEIIQVESEHSAISAAVGASASGARTVTATSSQGLALMNEILHIASGLRLPILMAVSARALSAPINIHGEHGDVMGARDAGWIQLFSETAQDVYDNMIIGMKLAEAVRVPVMVIMDGFNTSHCVENLEVLDKEKVRHFIGRYKPQNSLLDIENPATFGPLALQDSYFEFRIDQERAMKDARMAYKNIVAEYQALSSRRKGFFESYQAEDAENLMILMGSTAGTAKDVIDNLRKHDKKVGLIRLDLFRPFPRKELVKAISHAKNIAVLDRAMSIGTKPPLYTEIISALYQESEKQIPVQSYVYGLGGRDIFAKDLERVFNDLASGRIYKDVKYIGTK